MSNILKVVQTIPTTILVWPAIGSCFAALKRIVNFSILLHVNSRLWLAWMILQYLDVWGRCWPSFSRLSWQARASSAFSKEAFLTSIVGYWPRRSQRLDMSSPEAGHWSLLDFAKQEELPYDMMLASNYMYHLFNYYLVVIWCGTVGRVDSSDTDGPVVQKVKWYWSKGSSREHSP